MLEALFLKPLQLVQNIKIDGWRFYPCSRSSANKISFFFLKFRAEVAWIRQVIRINQIVFFKTRKSMVNYCSCRTTFHRRKKSFSRSPKSFMLENCLKKSEVCLPMTGAIKSFQLLPQKPFSTFWIKQPTGGYQLQSNCSHDKGEISPSTTGEIVSRYLLNSSTLDLQVK